MLTNVSGVLAMVYVPLMWSLIGVLFLLGIIGLLAPWTLRRVMNIFTRNRPARLLGIVLLVLGTEMFIQAQKTATPTLVKTLGVLMFLDGGVRLFVPTLSVIFMEKLKAMQPVKLRFLGLVQLAVAWLFYLASQLPPPPIVE